MAVSYLCAGHEKGLWTSPPLQCPHSSSFSSRELPFEQMQTSRRSKDYFGPKTQLHRYSNWIQTLVLQFFPIFSPKSEYMFPTQLKSVFSQAMIYVFVHILPELYSFLCQSKMTLCYPPPSPNPNTYTDI